MKSNLGLLFGEENSGYHLPLVLRYDTTVKSLSISNVGSLQYASTFTLHIRCNLCKGILTVANYASVLQ